MALKFALIVVVACMAQGFAQKPVGRPYPLPKPCKNTPESAEEIPHEFEEAMFEMDEVRETVSIATMEAYFKGVDPEVIIACFREQKGNYIQLGQRIAGLIRKSVEELAKDLGEKYEEFASKAKEPLRNIAVTMKMLPQKIWALIKDKEFGKALELMRESRKIVEENAKLLAKAINELREELPETAEKAEEMAKEIRNEARKGCEAISKAFRECVEAGGPKNPVEDDSESEEETSED